MQTKRPLLFDLDAADLEDAGSDDENSVPGDRLTTNVTIFGQEFHLVFIRVKQDGDLQVGSCPYNEQDMEALGQLYGYAFQTVKVPGYDGDYVGYMHPFAD